MKTTESQNSPATNEVRQLLKKIKEERGLNQNQIADALFVHYTTVGKWKKGLAGPKGPTLENLRRLATGEQLVLGEKQLLARAKARVKKGEQQSFISIHLEVDPLNLNEEARRKIRTVQTILATLENLTEQK